MIRNAVIHIANEQPLVADLYEMPTATDVSLVCTNIRMLDGKKPVFIDHAESVFVFPYVTIRFLELPASAAPGLSGVPGETTETALVAATDADGLDGDDELDEDFLRRIREV